MNERHGEVHSLAAAYALDALPADEERFFESHLPHCSACMQEVAEFRDTAAALGSAAAEPAPAELRGKVLAQIDMTRQDPPLLPDHTLAADPPTKRLKAAVLSVAAAALIVVVGLTAVVAGLNRRLDDLEARSGEIHHVLASQDVRTVDLAAAGAVARLIVSETSGAGLFVAEGLAPLPEGMVYELWLIRASEPAPAGIFRPDGEGSAVQILTGDVRSADAVALTVEPAGGSLQPTSDPVMAAEL